MGVLGTAVESNLHFTPTGGQDPFGINTQPISKPVFMAVEGTCLNLGVELILASVLAMANETIIFGQLEVRRGIMPLGEGNTPFTACVGWANASRYLLTGETFNEDKPLLIELID